MDRKARCTNLELLRIIAMFLIIAHHFVVNSGITEKYDFNNITVNMLFLQFLGMWGKMAINIFVIISGYFMCNRKLTVKRFCKIYLEAKFYSIVIFLIFLIAGYEVIGVGSMLNLIFGYLRNPNNGFTASFLMFYLFIPFYNMLIENMNQNQHKCLLCMTIIYFTFASTFLLSDSVFHEPLWYMILYFFASYIRLYPANWMNNNKRIGLGLLGLIFLAYTSILVVDFVGVKFGFVHAYYMVSNSNKLFAFLIATFMFLFFKNMRMKNSPIVNKIAATTFGILCIHASSDAMRIFLWKDLFNVSDHYSIPLPDLVLYSMATIVGVFVICMLIDMFRIRFIEKPVFNWLDKYKWFNNEVY